MKIVDIKVITLEGGHYKLVRVDTDEGLYGYGEASWGARGPVPKEYIQFFKRHVVGLDPTNVENIMIQIRHMGGFGQLGNAASAIECACWDIAGKAAGLPVYKLLGGKIRDRIRIYVDSGSGVQLDPNDRSSRYRPEAYAEKARRRLALRDGFTIHKYDIGLHGPHLWHVPGGIYEENQAYPYQGHATEKGLKAEIAIVEALKGVLGDEIGLAIDAGPAQSLQASMVLAKALEPYNLVWIEDLLQGADNHFFDPTAFRLLSESTSTPILAGENGYLRTGFRDLLDQQAVDIVAPDLHHCGGLAELKWLAEFADLHGIQIAPHNANFAIAFMANLHVGAVMPRNYIAFEFHLTDGFPWWEDALTGVEKPLIKDGFAKVPDRPGLGFDLNEEVIRQHLAPGETWFE